MSSSVESSLQALAQKWFRAAIRWYVEEHQGCPRCQGRHCVFRARWGNRIEYHCTGCDFSAAHDEVTGVYAATNGEAMPSGVSLDGEATLAPSPLL
jgi:hypothetical protein